MWCGWLPGAVKFFRLATKTSKNSNSFKNKFLRNDPLNMQIFERSEVSAVVLRKFSCFEQVSLFFRISRASVFNEFSCCLNAV